MTEQPRRKKVPFSSEDFNKMMDDVLSMPDIGAMPAVNANPDIQRLVEAGKRYQAEVSQKREQGVPQ